MPWANRDLGGKCGLKAGHDDCRQATAGKPDQQPGQAIAHPPPRRQLQGRFGVIGRADDAGQTPDVLVVLTAQYVDQRDRRYDAQKAALRVHHRNGDQTLIVGERRHMRIGPITARSGASRGAASSAATGTTPSGR
jgi:hypothetical protein